ncbi:MAG: multidrug efflux SMR transporter [Solirubrobacteraceae bacterium]|nr:multidrug efflux SMR transporter [Solirubrobacteraceae bacterium]
MAWALLLLAGLLEMVWAIALKQSDGLSRLWPTVIFAVVSTISIVLLALALRSLPVSVGYAVWTGTGAVGVATLGMALLGEPATLGRIVPIALVTVGIVWLALGD